jgi:5'-deoxy-5'-methylthioadenosine phosphorylase
MLAIVTGSGFTEPPALDAAAAAVVDTPYGAVSVLRGSWHGRPVAFLARHGPDHSVPPHRVNYRANIWALRSAGCTAIVATAVSGGIADDLSPGDLVLIDQFIEFTRGRADTFFDDEVCHTDMTEPYSPALRSLVADAASAAGVPLRPRGTYVCTNGPRFETPAEIAAFRALGAELVGMTGYPEVVLANEAGLSYASIGVISNPAAGLAGGAPISLEEIRAIVSGARQRVLAVVEEVVRRWPPRS